MNQTMFSANLPDFHRDYGGIGLFEKKKDKINKTNSISPEYNFIVVSRRLANVVTILVR